MNQCDHHDYTMVEDYIRSMQWSPETTDQEKGIAIGNIRGFYEHMRANSPPAGGFVVDAMARIIYDQWGYQKDWVPWVDRGNSSKQDEARALVRKALSTTPTAQPSAKDGVRESVDDVLRMLLAERNHRTDGDTWALADRARHLSRGDKCLINELESEATTATGLVDDAMVKRALNAQPFVAENVATRVWQLITGGVTNSERAMRAALEAALGREVGP